MTTVYLAISHARQFLLDAFPSRPDPPAMLVSHPYSHHFFKERANFHIREWVLDSGAFTQFNAGKPPLAINDYIDFCKMARDTDSQLAAIFALDVVGDWKTTLANTEALWKAGVEAIPCFHAGEPEDVLLGMARDYPRIAIGGASGRLYGNQRIKFLEQCVARVWPKRIHCFGVTDNRILERLPFDSVDSSSWDYRPTQFGIFSSYARRDGRPHGLYMGRRKGKTGELRLLPEVNHYLQLESRLKQKWGKELAKL